MKAETGELHLQGKGQVGPTDARKVSLEPALEHGAVAAFMSDSQPVSLGNK